MKHELKPTLETGPSPYPTLLIKYSLIFLYGVSSGIVGVVTLDVVAGSQWSLIWPGLIAATSLSAVFGVLWSRRTGRYLPEIVATLLMLALFAGYVFAIVYRGVHTGEFFRLPGGWLPIILSVFPSSRLVHIVRKRVKR